MLRHEWTFKYGRQALQDAAGAKRRHHDERLQFWRVEMGKADALLREKGVEFRENVVTGGVRTDAVLDPQLANRVAECRAKIKEHESKRDEYARWERMFSRAIQSTLDLHADDVGYFGVADEDAPVPAAAARGA